MSKSESGTPYPLVRVVLVGNRPPVADLSTSIDTADVVVRFNDFLGWGAGYGVKTTYVYFCNMGPPSRRLLAARTLHERIAKSGCRSVVLTYASKTWAEIFMQTCRGNGRRITDRSKEIRQALDDVAVPTLRLPNRIESTLRARMRQHPDFARFAARQTYWAPSSGGIALAHIAELVSPAIPMYELAGFGFRGWPGHPWFAEKDLALELAAAGRLRFLDGDIL